VQQIPVIHAQRPGQSTADWRQSITCSEMCVHTAVCTLQCTVVLQYTGITQACIRTQELVPLFGMSKSGDGFELQELMEVGGWSEANELSDRS
jgi:hypothetical protein